MVASGGGAVYCVVGSCGASGAVVDVAAGESVCAGEIAGSYQFVAGVDGDGGAAAVYTGVFGGDFAYGENSFAGGAVFSGGGAVGGGLVASDGGDTGACGRDGGETGLENRDLTPRPRRQQPIT